MINVSKRRQRMSRLEAKAEVIARIFWKGYPSFQNILKWTCSPLRLSAKAFRQETTYTQNRRNQLNLAGVTINVLYRAANRSGMGAVMGRH